MQNSNTSSRVSGGRIGAADRRLSFQRRRVSSGATSVATTVQSQGQPSVKVFNELGDDVTPKPLMLIDPRRMYANRNYSSPTIDLEPHGVGSTPAELVTEWSGTFLADPGLSRSVFSGSAMQGIRSTTSVMNDDADDTEVSGGPLDLATGSGAARKAMYRYSTVDEPLTDVELKQEVILYLHESDTFNFVDIPGTSLQSATDEGFVVSDSNNTYTMLCKSRAGNDRYMERGVNTYTDPLIDKEILTEPLTYKEKGVDVSWWDICDTYAAEGSETLVEQVSSQMSVTEEDEELVIVDNSMSLLKDNERILQSEALKHALFLTERALCLNSYQQKLSHYRGLPEIINPFAVDGVASEEIVNIESSASVFLGFDMEPPAEGSGMLSPTGAPAASGASNSGITGTMSMASSANVEVIGPGLDRLWAFQCPLTKGRNVCCMAWNKANRDLLAVGYCQYEFNKQKPGLVCCWTPKNPEYPERLYLSDVGVTAIDFCIGRPNLLAVGYYDGVIAVFNIGVMDTQPQVDSANVEGRHVGPVWQLRWVSGQFDVQLDHPEKLTSISADGHIAQWVIRKGLECNTIHKLKRPPEKTTSETKVKGTRETEVSQLAGGMCLDFAPTDTNLYLAGTDNGHIHRCLVTYTEQYSQTFAKCTGPVYRVQWSPFCPNVFLSCGSDWSVHLWSQDDRQPAISLSSTTKSICDACWSPHSSLVIACVNEAALEVWDLAQNVLDPILVKPTPGGIKLSSVMFSHTSNAILVGDNDGAITVYELQGTPPPPGNQGDALQLLIDGALASKFNKGPSG